jgi:hypothetical protein
MSAGPITFVDRNVLVYAHDASAGDKRGRGRRFVDRPVGERTRSSPVRKCCRSFT